MSFSIPTIHSINLNYNHTDYFLPSKGDLNLMWVHLHLWGVGGFKIDNYYWSSSESSASYAYFQIFSNGGVGDSAKNTSCYVRACRKFTSTTVYNLRDVGPAGGLIFWISGNNYMETSPTDLNSSPDKAWSNILYAAIGTTDTADLTGQANTIAIINQVVLGSELITGWTNTGGWDTLTTVGKDITLAIKPDSDSAICVTNTIPSPPSTIRLVINLILNSGSVPALRCLFIRGGVSYYTDLDVLVAGSNTIDYIVPVGDTDVYFTLTNIIVEGNAPYTNVNCNFSAEFSVKELIGIHTDSAAKLCDDLIV